MVCHRKLLVLLSSVVCRLWRKHKRQKIKQLKVGFVPFGCALAWWPNLSRFMRYKRCSRMCVFSIFTPVTVMISCSGQFKVHLHWGPWIFVIFLSCHSPRLNEYGARAQHCGVCSQTPACVWKTSVCCIVAAWSNTPKQSDCLSFWRLGTLSQQQFMLSVAVTSASRLCWCECTWYFMVLLL